jgi:hypothetical protein
MNMWKLALPVSLLAVGMVMGAAAPSYAGVFGGTYGFNSGNISATESGDAIAPLNIVNFSNLSAGNGLSNPGVTGNNAGLNGNGRGYSASGWNQTGTANAVFANDYLEFGITAPTSGSITVNSFSFDYLRGRSVDSPTTWFLRAQIPSVNSGSFFDVLSNGSLTGNNTWQQVNSALSANITGAALSNLSGVTQAITFRLYAFGGNSSIDGLDLGPLMNGNNLGPLTVDNLRVGGTTPVPTPAAIPAIIAFGAGLWRKRKQQDTEVA